MAVSLDRVGLLPKTPAVPREAPLAMPAQDFTHADPQDFHPPHWRTGLARVLVFAGALALTVYAIYEMVQVISQTSVSSLQWVLVFFFTLTFGWIALAATSAVAGLLLGHSRPRARPLPLKGKVVLLMPVYNEDPARTCAGLLSMGQALMAHGEAERFEIFVISDTRDPAVWLRETAAVAQLREALGPALKVWYRRRRVNEGKKAGNVAEFVKRWGGRYDYMLVLDADSLLAPDTLLTLAREMDQDPSLGILQTLPRLCGGDTLFGRLQQFAGVVYGPVVARGITAWQGDDGNYWGHNALIRVRAFAEAAGLPRLPGKAPFGGHILSHDFVEAALIRRAGWAVRMLPTLGGSWEESPPSLMDVAVRDRRWAQGNMQHLAVMKAKGLRWPNRVHMAIGVMSYLASPLWLLLIVTGLITTFYAASIEHVYFTSEFSLFPNWPIFDSERMVRLFKITIGVLLVPKFLGLALALCNSGLRRSMGSLRMVAGAFVETAFSVLYAPIFMLIHSKHIWDILRGRDSGWAAQARGYSNRPWKLFLRQHWGHTLFGLTVGAALWVYSLPLLAWMAPTVLGLVLAIPLARLSGSRQAARWLGEAGLLTIPEEVAPAPVMQARDQAEGELRQRVESVDLDLLLRDPEACQRHFALCSAPVCHPRGKPPLERLSARLKLEEAHHRQEALGWLDAGERLEVLSDAELFGLLLALPEQPPAPAPLDAQPPALKRAL